jgi:hypothetical protein
LKGGALFAGDQAPVLDEITAAVLIPGIVFYAHSPGYAGSVYHEIFHSF